MTLRVRLEIVSFGDEDHVREIGRLDISNTGKTMLGVTAYSVVELTPQDGAIHEELIFHRRENGAWALVAEALRQLKISGP